MTPSAMYLLTFFLCHPSATQEAMCGPSTGQYGPYATIQECEGAAKTYLYSVRDVPVLNAQQWGCMPVGMGIMKRKEGLPQ